MAEEKQETEMVNEQDVKHGDEVKADKATEATEGAVTTDSETLDAAELAKQLEGAQARIRELNKENEKRRLEEKERKLKELEEQGRYKELLEERQAELEALQKQTEQREAYIDKANETLRVQVEAEIKDWDDELKSLIDTDADVLTQLNLVNRLRKVHEKLKKPSNVGNASGPAPNGGLGAAERTKEFKKNMLEQYRRNF